MHLLAVVRAYLGMNQSSLAKAVGITQPDLCEMELHKPYGKIHKYQRVSEYLGIPVDAIVKNDCSCIPLSFFEKHTVPEYRTVSNSSEAKLGRMGEEYVFCREQARLQELNPALARLVVPCYKMPMPFPGYDIISFDDAGCPFFLEVKTSMENHKIFRMSKHEMATATRMTKQGERYVITCISSYGTAQQQEVDIPFENLTDTYQVNPANYFCVPLREAKNQPITGLAYFRQLHRLRQRELSEALDIPPSNWCLYETGQRTPSITTYLKISEFLDVPIDALIATYPSAPVEESAYE